MQRIHVHILVRDLERSVGFYSALFDCQPVVRKPDYAKWQVDDMQVNFAITEQADGAGLDHLGIQVDEPDELAEVESRLEGAGRPRVGSEAVHCCYARVNQGWTLDPQGVLWEAFRTEGTSELYCDGGEALRNLRSTAAADCAECA